MPCSGRPGPRAVHGSELVRGAGAGVLGDGTPEADVQVREVAPFVPDDPVAVRGAFEEGVEKLGALTGRERVVAQ